MATLTKGKTFANGELVTPQKLHELVDLGMVTGIVNADISASAAIADTKLAQITTANKVAQSAVANLTTDLAGKAATSHPHTIANVTGLQTALDGKQAAGSYAPATGIAPSAISGTAVITTDSRLSDARTPTSHTHDDRYYTETEMNTLLAGKQAAGSYAASSHNHDASNITSGTIANARTTATSDNTSNAIVARDANGNFSAGSISANALNIQQNGNAIHTITTASADGSAFPEIQFRKTLGTLAGPLNTANGLDLGQLRWFSYFNGLSETARIRCVDLGQNGSNQKLGQLQFGLRNGQNGFPNVLTLAFDGTATFSGNVFAQTVNLTSDKNSKENIEYNYKNSLEKINLLKPATFNYINDSKKQNGFIAQDVQEVFPDLIEANENVLAIKMFGLLPHLVAAVQELAARVAVLESK